MASFLFLIDYAARLLRPVRLVALVCDQGLDVIRSVYPEEETTTDGEERARSEQAWLGPPSRVVPHQGRSQIVLAIEIKSLVQEARRLDGVIEFVPQVGDFIADDEPLFNLYGGAASIDEAILRGTVVFGTERTMEQDPMFAFRILVDIAIKALSPAINDPTTAVLAIDQIHRLLRMVGRRHLRGEGIRDAAGHVRLELRTPNWEDFVHIACSEIRACGAEQHPGRATHARHAREPDPHAADAARHAGAEGTTRPAGPHAAGVLQVRGGPGAGPRCRIRRASAERRPGRVPREADGGRSCNH